MTDGGGMRWAPIMLMAAVGGLVGAVWGIWWGSLLIAPVSAAVGWAVAQDERRQR